MKRTTQTLALITCLGVLLSAPSSVRSAESAAKPTCPSLDGDWAGDFDGAFAGTWHAIFTQVGTDVQASADITVDSGPRLEAQGSAGVKCVGGKTTIAGSGSARDKIGSFSGVSDEAGKKLSGTWWSGDLFGTWRGERQTDER